MSTGIPAPMQDALPQGHSADLALMSHLSGMQTMRPSGSRSAAARAFQRTYLGCRRRKQYPGLAFASIRPFRLDAPISLRKRI